jgi:hypothetical protein
MFNFSHKEAPFPILCTAYDRYIALLMLPLIAAAASDVFLLGSTPSARQQAIN